MLQALNLFFLAKFPTQISTLFEQQDPLYDSKKS